jgi:hypothetical protein
MDYVKIQETIRKANAEAFAAHTSLMISIKPMSQREAIKKTVQLMIKQPLEICDHRIIHYLKILDYGQKNAQVGYPKTT